MPALPLVDLPSESQLDSLSARSPDLAGPIARQPAVGDATDIAGALEALTERSASPEKRSTVMYSGVDSGNIVTGIIPTYYNYNGPTAGTVVGIVLGSVAGFLIIVWLLYSLSGANTSVNSGTAIAGEEEIVVRKPRRGSDSRRSRRSTRTEVREYSRSPRRREQVIVDERRAAPQRARSRSIIVEDRARVPGDDVVEVIEEHDEYRTRRGNRRSGSNYRGY